MILKIIFCFFILRNTFCVKNKIDQKQDHLEKKNYITEEICKKLSKKQINSEIKIICKDFLKTKKLNHEEKKEIDFFKDFSNIFIHHNKSNILKENKYKDFKEIIFLKHAKWKNEENFESLLIDMPNFIIDSEPSKKDKKIKLKKLYINKKSSEKNIE